VSIRSALAAPLLLAIYTRWFGEYGTSNGGVQFHHLPRGSAEGNSMVSSGSTDFGGSEVPPNDEELPKIPTKLLLLPSVVGGVVPIYNLPGIRQELRITSEVLAGIYLGTIRFAESLGYARLPEALRREELASSEDCDPN
jgi:ABC-type phosphate transport system substrate-binding protein